MFIIKKFFIQIEKLNFSYKQFIFGIFDLLFIYFSFYIAIWFGSNQNELSLNLNLYKGIFFISAFSTIIVYLKSDFYSSITKYTISPLFYSLTIKNIISFTFTFGISIIFNLPHPNLKVWILFLLFSVIITGYSRYIFRDIVNYIGNENDNYEKRVAIYGAGNAGALLANTLLVKKKFKINCFIDDDYQKTRRKLYQIPIYTPEFLYKNKNLVDLILVAIPSLSYNKRREFFLKLQKVGIPFLAVPDLTDLSTGKVKIDKLQPVLLDDFLGRDKVEFDKQKLSKNVKDLNICVTGGGGSIGIELCKQLLELNPKRIVILEISEPNLYKVEQILLNKNKKNIDFKIFLGSALDKKLVEEIFFQEKIDIIFHAAAYKHVPLVEKNPIEGIKNNVFSTKILCEAAMKMNLKNFVLISTDKAVRPTNIMGASKRLAELIVQSFSEISKKNNKSGVFTKFSMVRFGNVLGSSGSVVPLFQKQIEKGGPVTITHPDVIRYFMTISEAVSLVIESTFYAKSGDVFLLDMGDSMKISDLALKMIQVNGLTVRNENNPNGDIEVKYIGLRPGEKLYEELIINADAKITPNKKIFSALEKSILYENLIPKIDTLKKLIEERNEKGILKILKELVPEWNQYI